MYGILNHTPPLLRQWMRTPHVYRHAPAPFRVGLSRQSLLGYSRPYAKYPKSPLKRTADPQPPRYQRPITGSKWYIAFVDWAKRPWREKCGSVWEALRSPKTYRSILKFTFYAFNAFCATHLFFSYVLGISTMMGPSMLPTFANRGDIILEDKVTYALFPHKLARGDIVLVESPVERGHKVCKRVLGLPGDVVCVDPTGRYAPSDQHVLIPKGHIWIIGDNSNMSRDSRVYGPVPMALVKARVLARVWPPSKICLFPGHNNVTNLS